MGTDGCGVTKFDERMAAVDALLMFAAGVIARRPADNAPMDRAESQALAARAGVVAKMQIDAVCGPACRCIGLPFPVTCYQPVPGVSEVAGEALAKLLSRPE